MAKNKALYLKIQHLQGEKEQIKNKMDTMKRKANYGASDKPSFLHS